MTKIIAVNTKEEDKSWEFEVSVVDESGTSLYKVTLKKDLAESFGKGILPNDIVVAAFEFLLKRESKEAILPEFDIEDITTYFPEFLEVVKEDLLLGQ